MPDPKKYDLFRLFVPTEGKVMYFAKKLMEEYLYLDDQWRDYTTIHRILNGYVNNERMNVIYEIGDFDGILGFTDIIPGWKAHMTFKLWNKERWGPDFVRQAKQFIQEVFTELRLVRLETGSPDPRIVKMARMVNFIIEGVRKKEFSWDGKLYDNTMLAIVK